MRKKALILVDIQNDFLPGGALGVPNGDEILPLIEQLSSLPFDYIVATQDWHPKNHTSFAVNHKKNPGDKIILNGIEQILWPVHCVQDTKGAKIAKGAHIQKINKVIHKGTDTNIDSYSTFFDNGRLKSTGLEDFLKEHKVKDIYLAGLATDYCVKYSVLDALQLGFNVYVVSDACRGINLKAHDSRTALTEMEKTGAILTTTEELIRIFDAR